MANRLEAGLRAIPDVEIIYPVEANAVFAKFPTKVEKQLHTRGWKFYTGVITAEESRLMCSWDTTPDDVDAFVTDVQRLTESANVPAQV